MKKYFLSVLVTLFVLSNFSHVGHAQKPDYEKYGRIAISIVKEDYPGEEIREYEYLGRKKINETKVEDSFRFQVQEKNEKWFVSVKVTHDISNNKVLNITVESKKQ
jgi:Protein of unknown function (DUF3889)